jgi:hypothetical protein
MSKTGLTGGFVGCMAFLFSVGVFADNHEEDRGAISDVWVLAIKRGMESEFTSAMAEHMAARKEMGEERVWYAYRAEVGQHPGLVMYRSEPMSRADHDAYLASDLEEIGNDFGENVDPLVDHFHHYIDTYDWKNSHWPDDETTEGPLFIEYAHKWKSDGGWWRSDQARQRMAQIALTQGWAEKGYEWLWIDRTGGAPVQAFVIPMASYEAMAPGEDFGEWLYQQVGGMSAEMFRIQTSAYAATDVTVWRYDPEISTPSD